MLKKMILVLTAMILFTSCDQTATDPSAITVKIYKSDGSKQCEDPGISLADMQLELTDNNIAVLSANCAFMTGVSVPAVCGGVTLRINVYEINVAELEEAQKLGFASVNELSDSNRGYRITDCVS